jgi:predicted nucleotide-binding protein (sugar kinase/HSP70/actin superfamily)
VFLDTARVTCQKNGFAPAEILAAYAHVLPRNIWENVAGGVSLESLGRVFVLSGGVQLNRAALDAHADYIRARHPHASVVVHPYPGEAGAIGAAIEARASVKGSTQFVGFARARETQFSSRTDDSTRCRRCPSACPRTFVDARPLAGPRTTGAATTPARALRLVTGHACERGASHGPGDASAEEASPSHGARDLLRTEASRLFERVIDVRTCSTAARGLRVAIPRVLSMYRSAPFFTHYLEAIGVARADIVTGTPTTDALWRRSAGRGTVDACFPVKVAQAHVAELLRERIDVMFFPALTHALTAVRGCCDTASCPVVAGTPLTLRAAFGVGANGRAVRHVPDHDPVWLNPTLVLTDPKRLAARLFESIQTVAPALEWAEHLGALEQARTAQRTFEATLERDGVEALERARTTRRAAVVILGRPYHADPGIHHDIGSELRALGRTTLSTRALPKSGVALDALGGADVFDLSGDAPAMTNSGDGEKLAALRLVAAHPFLVAIELSSFKCGQDASLYADVASRARAGGRPFLALHDLDETRPVGSLRLRLRTFLDAVERWERRHTMPEVRA